MPVDIICGMSFGSEGKGRLIEQIASNYDILVRTGAPNAGHKVWNINSSGDKRQYAHQIIPCGIWANPEAVAVLGAGAMLDLEQLTKELNWIKYEGLPFSPEKQLYIDENAVIIDQIHVDEEQPMHERMGSTAHGCGAALISKIRRDGSIRQVKNVPELKPFVTDTIKFLNDSLDNGQRVMIEGTQGSMLSLHTTPYYPFCTSRDTNASNWLAEAGLAPGWVDTIWGVLRPYPIRVHGNSGPTGAAELTWEEVRDRSGNNAVVPEITTVTKKTRRIFEFSPTDFNRAMSINRPSKLCLNFADYIDVKNFGLSYHNDGHQLEDLSPRTHEWMMEHLGANVDLIECVGTGPDFEHVLFS